MRSLNPYPFLRQGKAELTFVRPGLAAVPEPVVGPAGPAAHWLVVQPVSATWSGWETWQSLESWFTLDLCVS